MALLPSLLPANPAHADSIRQKQWHLTFLDIAAAHAVTKGAGVRVAVVDTGVAQHPDLKANLLPGASTDRKAPGDGRTDSNGHGTAMAGLIAGGGHGSNEGILGIAPEAKVIPFKGRNPEDTSDNDIFATAVKLAAESDAQVMNVSASTGPSITMNRAIETAAERDIVVVASSGNRPQDSRIGYPAATPGVLTVGAVDKSGEHATFSIEASEVQLCAPGVDMETTGPKSNYGVSNGTSPAAAIVSGAAALVRAKFPDLSAQQVIERLTSTATDVGPPGRDKECGFGVLNIVKALTSGSPSASNRSEPASPAPTTTTTHTAPDADEGTPVALVASVVGGLVVVLGGLVGLLVARRRRGAG